MSRPLLRLIFTASSLFGGSFLYVLQAFSSDQFDVVMIGPMLGFSFGACLVIGMLWIRPRPAGPGRARQRPGWRHRVLQLGAGIAAGIAPYAAGFMVWVSAGFFMAAVSWLFGLSDVTGEAASVAVLISFLAAQIFVLKTWPMALIADEPLAS